MIINVKWDVGLLFCVYNIYSMSLFNTDRVVVTSDVTIVELVGVCLIALCLLMREESMG